MMTEIERELLRAFESLQSAHASQLKSLQSELETMRGTQQAQRESYMHALSALQQRFEQSQAGERALSQQLSSLAQQLDDLRRQVRSLSDALPR